MAAAPGRHQREIAAKLICSLAIALILGLQAFAIVRPFQPFKRWLDVPPKLLWPFLNYPMYAHPHVAGEPIVEYALFGTLPDGREVRIEPEDLGLRFWKFRSWIADPLFVGDTRALVRCASLYQEHRGGRLTSVRLEHHGVRFTPSGVRPMPPIVLGTFQIADGSHR